MKVLLVLVCLLLPAIFARTEIRQKILQRVKYTSCPSRLNPGTLLKCPYDNAVCCTNDDFCCPPGYSCADNRKCVQNSESSAVPNAAMSSMASVLQSAAQVQAPPVASSISMNSESSNPLSESSTPLSESTILGTNAVIPSSGTADVPFPHESSSAENNKPSVIIMKNVNALYKGPPKNGAVTTVLDKNEDSHHHHHHHHHHRRHRHEESGELSHEESGRHEESSHHEESSRQLNNEESGRHEESSRT